MKKLKATWKHFMMVTLPFIATGISLHVSSIVGKADVISDIVKKIEGQNIIVLIAYEDILQPNNIITYALRHLGWLFVQFLVMLCDETKALLDKAYMLLDFTEYQPIADFMNVARPILYSVFALALLFYAYNKMINPEFGGAILQNVVVAILVIVALPTAMNYANQIVSSSKTFIQTSENLQGATEAELVIGRNMRDILVADALGWKIKGTPKTIEEIERGVTDAQLNMRNSARNIEFTDPTEMIDADNDTNPLTTDNNPVSENILDNRLITITNPISKKTTYGIEEIDDGVVCKNIPPLTARYYRYQIEWLPIYITLIAWIVVFFFSAYKVVRIVFELTLEKMIAPFFATGDIANGKKVRQLLQGILNAYIVLVVIILIQKLFIYAQEYLSLTKAEGGLGLTALQQSIFLIFIALAVIDGPNLIEQLLGIDAGLKGGFGLFALARTVRTVAQAPINMARGVSSTIGAGYATPTSHQSSQEKVEEKDNLNDGSGENKSVLEGDKNNTENQSNANANSENVNQSQTATQENHGENNLNQENDGTQTNDQTGSEAGKDVSNNNGEMPDMGTDPSDRFGNEGLSDLFKNDMNNQANSGLDGVTGMGNLPNQSSLNGNPSATIIHGRDGRNGKDGIHGRDGKDMTSNNPTSPSPTQETTDRDYRSQQSKDNLNNNN